MYNLGTGRAHSFNTVVERINEVLGTDVAPRYVENPIPEGVYVHDTCADASKIRAKTGWEPVVDFDAGIRRACEPYLPE